MIESLISTNLNEWYSVTLQPLFAHSTCPRKMQEFTGQKEFPHASTAVCKSTYMDDSLDSVRDNQMAIQLFAELQGLWAKAGMKARKWLSNSPEVLKMIPQELRAYEINLKDSLPTAKTLGVTYFVTRTTKRQSGCNY